MPNYASYCPQCKKINYTQWGVMKCPNCGYPKMKQSRIEKIDFQSLSEAEQLETFTISEEEKEKINKSLEQKNLFMQQLANFKVTTCDLKEEYEIIGPVYFQINNHGFSASYTKLVKQYAEDIENLKESGQLSNDKRRAFDQWSMPDEGTLGLPIGNHGKYQGIAYDQFDKAFFISIQELKKRALILGADAIIGMRQDIDLDTEGIQYFYLQMYGTAVKINDK